MKQKIRNYFFAGLIAVVPISVTVFLIFFITEQLGGLWNFIFKMIPVVKNFPEPLLNVIGIILFLVLIMILGYLVQHYFGKAMMKRLEKLFMTIPFIKSIYSPAREITNTLFQNKTSFQKVVFIEYLHKDQYTMAFVTNEQLWKINDKDSVALFVPTSPNPTSGFFAVVPKDEVIETDLSVEEALKIIISSGMINTKEVKINDRKN
ncbi:MAG: DUF502 domain-containing protein [bacterium]|nr:DUF502 domain-containing protein [bacterium]